MNKVKTKMFILNIKDNDAPLTTAIKQSLFKSKEMIIYQVLFKKKFIYQIITKNGRLNKRLKHKYGN